ncbi:hypothetical protein GOBAR_DD04510 [Gossypium barbadense]|nr:hypothetical protein GOBAR_DD04510 [Gossypium barbadense]
MRFVQAKPQSLTSIQPFVPLYQPPVSFSRPPMPFSQPFLPHSQFVTLPPHTLPPLSQLLASLPNHLLKTLVNQFHPSSSQPLVLLLLPFKSSFHNTCSILSRPANSLHPPKWLLPPPLLIKPLIHNPLALSIKSLRCKRKCDIWKNSFSTSSASSRSSRNVSACLTRTMLKMSS